MAEAEDTATPSRDPRRLRPLSIQLGWNRWAEGSCLMTMGETRVLVTASLEDRVPPFLRGSGQGWITAEYAMLPRATRERSVREVVRGRQSGRSMEIQRLVGRSVRAVVDLEALGERTLTLDCDVLQADGGTRTCAVNAAFLAMLEALTGLAAVSPFTRPPVREWMGAVSVGWSQGTALLDLDYEEDKTIGVDMNLVMTASGQWIEIQGSAERTVFDRSALDALLAAGEDGIRRLIAAGQTAYRARHREAEASVVGQPGMGVGES